MVAQPVLCLPMHGVARSSVSNRPLRIKASLKLRLAFLFEHGKEEEGASMANPKFV